jgi:hypothetical protein
MLQLISKHWFQVFFKKNLIKGQLSKNLRVLISLLKIVCLASHQLALPLRDPTQQQKMIVNLVIMESFTQTTILGLVKTSVKRANRNF